MPHQANTDHRLAETGGRQRGSATKLLLVAGVLLTAGLLFLLFGGNESILTYVGIALMALGAVPGIAGIALLVTGIVSGRASERKPFA